MCPSVSWTRFSRYRRFVSTVARSIVRISATAIDRAKSFRAVCRVSWRVETLNPWALLGRAKPLREPAKTISPVLKLYPDSDLKHLPLLCYVSDVLGTEECRRRRRVPGRTWGGKGWCMPLACMEMNEYIPPRVYTSSRLVKDLLFPFLAFSSSTYSLTRVLPRNPRNSRLPFFDSD